MDKQKEIARNTLMNVLKELIIRSDKFNVSPAKFNTLVKAYFALEKFPEPVITGYIDISSNTHLPGGALDYASFTINPANFEIYNGFVSYKNGESEDSAWEKIFNSDDAAHDTQANKKLELWAEGFLLHLENEPKRSLLVIDRSKINSEPEIPAFAGKKQ